MKKLTFGVAVAAAVILFTSGCGILKANGLSDKCQNAIDEVAEYLRNGDLSQPSPIDESGENPCKDEDISAFSSEMIVVSVNALNDRENSQDKAGGLYTIAIMCDSLKQMDEVTLTDQAKEKCAYAAENGQSYLSGLGFEELEGTDAFVWHNNSTTTTTDPYDGRDATNELGPKQVPEYDLSYYVEGSGPAQVTYIDGSNVYHDDYVSLPWSLSIKSTQDYSTVSVIAEEPGDVSCVILVGNRAVDRKTGSGSFPSADCYHFEP